MTELRYAREGGMVRLKLKGLNNHELREVLVGLWSRLDRADQEDHIRELHHYLEPGSWLSPIARVIANPEHEDTAIDVDRMIRQEGIDR